MLTLKLWHIRAILCQQRTPQDNLTWICESRTWTSVKLTCVGPLSFKKKHYRVKNWWACKTWTIAVIWQQHRSLNLLQSDSLLWRFDVSKYLNEECNVTCNGQRFILPRLFVYAGNSNKCESWNKYLSKKMRKRQFEQQYLYYFSFLQERRFSTFNLIDF